MLSLSIQEREVNSAIHLESGYIKIKIFKKFDGIVHCVIKTWVASEYLQDNVGCMPQKAVERPGEACKRRLRDVTVSPTRELCALFFCVQNGSSRLFLTQDQLPDHPLHRLADWPLQHFTKSP